MKSSHRVILFTCYFIINIFTTYLIGGVFAKKNDITKASVELLDKEAVRFKEQHVLCKTNNPTKKSVDRLRLELKFEQLAVCVLSLLEKKNDDGWAWSTLGEAHLHLNMPKSSVVANTCFKQAAKLSGKLPVSIHEWHYLGPFVIGKTEVDGDPVASYGGIANVSRNRLKKGEKFFSELMPEGELKWTTYKQTTPTSYVEIVPKINWNDLVNSLGSTAITEWQGWAVAEFVVNENNLDIMIQCLGVHTVYIDEVPVTGDVYRREQYWYSVNLKRGFHSIFIRLRAKGQQVFRCQVEQAKSNLEITEPRYKPDIWNGYLFSGYIALPITNLQSSKWLKINRISLQEQSEGEQIAVALVGDKTVSIAPGQTLPVRLLLSAEDEHVIKAGCDSIELKLKVTSSDGQLVYPISLRCRKRPESFIFTFLDHDGSIQHGAGIHPLEACYDGLCPVLLTLHGTTVPAQNQADSYKHMVDGEFVFGAEAAWVVAPTRHGAHNWEGPGALTAMTAADRFCELVTSHDWLEDKASCQHIIFAGHSMGGHGAWHLATHFPDRALALVVLAGWIKKEEYGDSNLFFRHDIATSHVDPSVKAVLESCIAENEADRHVSNLQGMAVMTRVGANDRTIHPFLVRRMYRVLREHSINVTYVELPGKEHWWWDTVKTNDGGCVNDKQLRDFTNEHSALPAQSCDDEGGCSFTTSTFKDSTLSFKYTVMNPAFGGSMRGIQILQQLVPLRTSVIHVRTEDNGVVKVTTENALTLSIHEPIIRPVGWTRKIIQLDETRLDTSDVSIISTQKHLCLCKDQEKWVRCDECMTSESRLPGTLGPARTVAENHFLIVTGTLGSNEMTQALQELAVYIANLFFLTADTYAPVVKDKDLTAEKAGAHNLIVLGNSSENEYSSGLLEKIPLQIKDDHHLKLSKCSYARHGLLSLAPHSAGRLALMLQASDVEMMRHVVSLATPTIPPMTRSPFSNLLPDFVVLGEEYPAKGPGGYLCAGHYDNHWGIAPHLVSCAHCF